MEYQRPNTMSGKWFKASEVADGTRVKLVSEVKKTESQFKNKDGSIKYQDTGRIKIEGREELLNISINHPTIEGLIDAFGSNSIDWQNHVLTVVAEKVRVAGKMVIVGYLIPEGYEKVDDDLGFAHIIKKGKQAPAVAGPEEDNSF